MHEVQCQNHNNDADYDAESSLASIRNLTVQVEELTKRLTDETANLRGLELAHNKILFEVRPSLCLSTCELTIADPDKNKTLKLAHSQCCTEQQTLRDKICAAEVEVLHKSQPIYSRSYDVIHRHSPGSAVSNRNPEDAFEIYAPQRQTQLDCRLNFVMLRHRYVHC